MRHYFKVGSDGTVIGVASIDGGFTDELDLSDELNQHPTVVAHREFAQTEENFQGFLRWDCACPAEETVCHCPHKKFVDYYVDNGALILKTPLTVVVDDADQADLIAQTPLDYPPGTSVVVKLRAAVPDGTTVTVVGKGKASIIQADTVLTFTAGESTPVTLKAPAQGTIGRVIGSSRLIRQFSVALRGWA